MQRLIKWYRYGAASYFPESLSDQMYFQEVGHQPVIVTCQFRQLYFTFHARSSLVFPMGRWAHLRNFTFGFRGSGIFHGADI